MEIIFDLWIRRLWSHADPVEAEVCRRRQQVFDGHAAKVTRTRSFVGQKDGPTPAVEVEHLLQRVSDTSPGAADTYDCVVGLGIIQLHVATPLWKERHVPVGRHVPYCNARCANIHPKSIRCTSPLSCDWSSGFPIFRKSKLVNIKRLPLRCMHLLPPTKEEVNAFARVRLSVCLLARLLKNAWMDLDEMLRVDRCRDMDELINFCVRSGTGL